MTEDDIMSELEKKDFPVNIEEIMHTAYMQYSLSVNVGRAIPDVRDGLKPVNRRILYAMRQMGITKSHATVKCAKVVGECKTVYCSRGGVHNAYRIGNAVANSVATADSGLCHSKRLKNLARNLVGVQALSVKGNCGAVIENCHFVVLSFFVLEHTAPLTLYEKKVFSFFFFES